MRQFLWRGGSTSKRSYVKVKSTWRSEGLYKEEASVVCRTIPNFAYSARDGRENTL